MGKYRMTVDVETAGSYNPRIVELRLLRALNGTDNGRLNVFRFENVVIEDKYDG